MKSFTSTLAVYQLRSGFMTLCTEKKKKYLLRLRERETDRQTDRQTDRLGSACCVFGLMCPRPIVSNNQMCQRPAVFMNHYDLYSAFSLVSLVQFEKTPLLM